jgi:hypothetical protein
MCVQDNSKKRIIKAVEKMPQREHKNKYHCHLSYHWIACWEETIKGIEMEVYYAGSRENAPY